MNRFFAKGREAFARAQVDWVDNGIGVALVDTQALTVDTATMQYVSDLLAVQPDALVARADLTGRTATDGVLDADDVTMQTVAGDQAEALVIYLNTGSDNTSRLLLYIDTAEGLPVTPNGGEVDIRWDDGPNKIAIL